MTEQPQIPIAEYRDRRLGVDDVVTLFDDRVEVRWKRLTQSGQTTVPLNILSPCFTRFSGNNRDYFGVFLVGVGCVVAAIATALSLPPHYADLITIASGVCGCVFIGYLMYSLIYRETQFMFVNMSHSAAMIVLNARPRDVDAAAAFVDALASRIRLAQQLNSSEDRDDGLEIGKASQ